MFTGLIVVNTLFFLAINTGCTFLKSLEVHKQLDRREQAAADGHRIEVAYIDYPGDVYALEMRGILFDFKGEKNDSFEDDGAVSSLFYRIVE